MNLNLTKKKIKKKLKRVKQKSIKTEDPINLNKVIYTDVNTLFINLPKFKDQFVVVELETLEQKQYNKLVSCYRHMHHGIINIEECNAVNTKKIPINQGKFSKKGKVFKPNVLFRGLTEGKKTYDMSPYNLDYTKISVINGTRLGNNYIEDMGKEMKIFYDGLELKKRVNNKIDSQTEYMTDIYSADKVFLFMNVPTKGGIIEQINNYATFYKGLGKEVNFVCENYSQVPNEQLYDLSKLNVDNVYVITEVEDFTKIIPGDCLLVFLQVRIAYFFINFFENNKVIVQYHRNINDATPATLARLKQLNRAIKVGEIQLLEPQVSINTILGLNKSRELKNYIFEPEQKNHGKVNKVKNIGYISRLTDSDNAKNISGVIRIIKEAIQLNSNLVFHIYGDGDKKELFEKLGSNVIVHGFEYSKDKIYDNLDVVMLPSISEAYPMVLIEALVRGIKVISYKSSNMIEEIVGTEGGKVIELDNEKQFSTELANFEPYTRENVIEYSRKFVFNYQTMAKYLSPIKIPNYKKNDKLYLYDTRKEDDTIYLEFFSSGYLIDIDPVVIGSSFPMKTYPCRTDAPNIYSKIAHNVKNQFFTVEFNAKDFTQYDYLKFYKNNQVADIIITRQGATRIPLSTTDNIILENNVFVHEFLCITTEEDIFTYAESYVSEEKIFLFQDRENKGYDNGEALYKYAIASNQYKKENLYYVIEEDCDDYFRLLKEGFNVIYRNSIKHKVLFLISNAVCSAHIKSSILIPFDDNNYKFYKKSKTIFLQHGILFDESDYKYFLNSLVSPVDMMICSSVAEKALLERITDYSNIALTGLARHDLLNNEENKMDTIFYFPTWNRVIDMTDFENTSYYKGIVNLMYSEQIAASLKKNRVKIKFLLHPELEEYVALFKNTDVVEILDPIGLEFSKILSETSMFITDASSIAWDVAYQGKPVLVYAPYETHQTFEGTPMERMGYIKNDIQQATETLLELLDNNFKLLQTQSEEIAKFYAYNDKENSKRIMEAIEEII